MKDEVILAAVLLAATVLLLILTIVVLCIVLKSSKNRSNTKGASSEIPTSKTTHQYDNYAVERDTTGFYGNTKPNESRVSYYGNEGVDKSKAEWPKTYNMYAISRSYAFPKAGDESTGPENTPQPSSRPSSIAASSIREVNHKTFSEEVFEGLSYSNNSTKPREGETASQADRGSGVWKYRTPSETVSTHSQDTAPSVQGSTVSRDYRVVTEHRSYYTSFKPRNVSTSTETSFQVSEVSNGKSSGPTRERMTTHSVKSTGTKKVFTFNVN